MEREEDKRKGHGKGDGDGLQAPDFQRKCLQHDYDIKRLATSQLLVLNTLFGEDNKSGMCKDVIIMDGKLDELKKGQTKIEGTLERFISSVSTELKKKVEVPQYLQVIFTGLSVATILALAAYLWKLFTG